MPNILPKTSEFLNSFYNSRLQLYEAHRKSFDPKNDRYAYGSLELDEQNKLYSIIVEIIESFGHSKSILYLDIPEGYLSIEAVVDEIVKFKKAVEKDIVMVEKLTNKYYEQNKYFPILELSRTYLSEISKALDEVLRNDELKNHIKIGKDVFNIYINNGLKKSITIGLTLEEVLEIQKAIKKREDDLFVANKKLNLKNIERIQIFDNSKLLDQRSISAIRNEYQKMTNITGQIGVQLLQQCGLDVSDRFNMTAESKVGSNQLQVDVPFQKRKLFISHAAKDKEIVISFTEKILQIGLDIQPKTEIFNTSIEDTGIVSGEDFKARIKLELLNASAVILIITENYKKSEACLNEMGAAWALDIPVIPFILEPINYSTVGFLHNTNQILKLKSSNDIHKFVADWKGKLFGSDYHDGKLNQKISEFINSI